MNREVSKSCSYMFTKKKGVEEFFLRRIFKKRDRTFLFDFRSFNSLSMNVKEMMAK